MKTIRTQGSLAKAINLRKAGILLTLALLPLLAGVVVLAQTGHGYDLSWWTVNGSGGGTVSHGGSGYTLMGTAGQPNAGTALRGGGYTLVGGFWPVGAAAAEYEIYLPLILRNY